MLRGCQAGAAAILPVPPEVPSTLGIPPGSCPQPHVWDVPPGGIPPPFPAAGNTEPAPKVILTAFRIMIHWSCGVILC